MLSEILIVRPRNGVSTHSFFSHLSMYIWCFWLQEDCTLENVWNMGGLSILTSAPLMPPYVCFLCASKGQHEVKCFLAVADTDRPLNCIFQQVTTKRTLQYFFVHRQINHFYMLIFADAALPSVLRAFPPLLPRTSRTAI